MPHAAPAAQAPAVLLVEDDAALSGYLAAALRGKGYHVHCATDRASALACMEQPHAPALVLLDLGLPPHPSTMREGLYSPARTKPPPHTKPCAWARLIF